MEIAHVWALLSGNAVEEATSFQPSLPLTPPQPLPEIERLRGLFDQRPDLRDLLLRGIEESKGTEKPTRFGSIHECCNLLEAIVQLPPAYDPAGNFVGCPVNALFHPLLITPSGRMLFRTEALNTVLSDLLRRYAEFLQSADSALFLTEANPYGWFSPSAKAKIHMEEFACQPDRPHYGYASYNAFFLRKFKKGRRTIPTPERSEVIGAPCESKVYAVHHPLERKTPYWIKGAGYSLSDLTNSDPAWMERYTNGTLIQGFLESHYYHRWHAPVSGRITRIVRRSGTYFAADEASGTDGLKQALPTLAHLATRMFIEIDTGAVFGKVLCVFIGMAEVSSCVSTVAVGNQVNRGAEIGYFQYGGSSYCLLVEPNRTLNICVTPQRNLEKADKTLLHTIVATITH